MIGLSLKEALHTHRLEDFIIQEEANGVGPVQEADFDCLVVKVIRSGQSGDQTSGSLPAGGLPGK